MEKEKIFLKNLEEITEHMLQMRQWAEQATDIIARDGDMPMTAAGARDAFDSIDKLTFYVRSLEEYHTEEDLQQFKLLWNDELEKLSYIYNYLANLNAPLYDDDFKMKMIQLNGEVEEFLIKTKKLNQEEKSENTQQANEQNQKQRNMQKTDVVQKQDEVDRALETQRQESKENPGKGNEQQEKAIREQVSKNKEENVPQEQKVEDRVRREDYPSFRAGVNAIVDKYKDDELVVQEPNNLLEQQKKEEARRKIESFILAYDNLSSNDPNEAKYELDKFSKYISSAMREGIIPKQEAMQYKDIINNAYLNKESAFKTVEKLWDLNEKYNTSQVRQTEPKTMDSPLDKREDTRSKTIKDVAQKQDEVDRALETKRQESRENPGKGNEQQEKAIREQLKEKEPFEKGEDDGGKKIDRPRAFKKGSENVKKLAQSNQQKMMAYYRKKRKDEWSDY